MAFLPDAEREGILRNWPSHAREFASTHRVGEVRTNLEKTHQTGYSVNPGLVLEGSWGMGAAVFDHRERPSWALSLTGIEPRFKEERRQRLGQLLMEEAQRISAHLRASTGRYEALSKITPFPAEFQRPVE